MTAADLIAELAQVGIRLSRNGDRLHVEAKPGSVTPAIRDRLAANKVELLKSLAVVISDNVAAIRGRLLSLAESEGLPVSVVETIPDNELYLYDELADADLLLPLHLRARCPTCTPRGTI